MARARWIGLILLAAGLSFAAYRVSASAAGAQDVRSLEMRMNSLEQRFYSLESRLSGVEQMARGAQRPSPSTGPAGGQNLEIERLRNEVETLKRRLREVECGVVRLDERTLPAAAKQGRAAAQDPCRAEPQSPVRITGRP